MSNPGGEKRMEGADRGLSHVPSGSRGRGAEPGPFLEPLRPRAGARCGEGCVLGGMRRFLLGAGPVPRAAAGGDAGSTGMLLAPRPCPPLMALCPPLSLPRGCRHGTTTPWHLHGSVPCPSPAGGVGTRGDTEAVLWGLSPLGTAATSAVSHSSWAPKAWQAECGVPRVRVWCQGAGHPLQGAGLWRSPCMGLESGTSVPCLRV